ncbi:MAG TPA: MaoC family dehydratase [Eoetvoesiella sp.]
MLLVNTTSDVFPYVGKHLGTSDWVTIDQKMIDDFSRVTGDDSWIHTDPERARREFSHGRTIVHGMLTFSLITRLGGDIFNVKGRSRSINYGANTLRFPAPVLCDDRVRLHRSLKAASRIEGGLRVHYDNSVEIAGNERPALVAETLTIIYD